MAIMKYEIYSMSEAEFQSNANRVKEHIFDILEDEKFVTSEQAKTLKERYAIIVYKKGWLGKAIDKILNLEENALHFKLIKL